MTPFFFSFNIFSLQAKISWITYYIFCGGIEAVIAIKNKNYGSTDFKLYKGFNKRFKTLPYFSKVLIPVAIFNSIVVIPPFIINAILKSDFNSTILVFPSLSILFGVFLIIYKRTETAFWIIAVFIFFSILTPLFLFENNPLIGWYVWQLYIFILMGLTTIYTLHSIKHISFLTFMIFMPFLLFLIISLIDIGLANFIEKLILSVIIPFITCILGAIIGYQLSKRNEIIRNDIQFLHLDDAVKEFSISKNHLLNLLKNGKLKGFKVGYKWYLHKETLKNNLPLTPSKPSLP